MPELGPSIDHLRLGERITNVPVVIAEANANTTRDGKPYARYVLRDRTGTVAAIRWEHTVTADEPGCAALVKGSVDEYRGSLQLKLEELQLLPNPPADVIERLQSDIGPARRDQLMRQLEQAQRALPPVFWEIFIESLGHDPYDPEGPFWVWAAAQSKHHSERGGLAWHVLSMLADVEVLAPFYPGLDVDLLRLAVLTHDLGKIDCYEMNATGARQLSLDRNVGHTSYGIARVLAALAKLRAVGWEITAQDEENLLHCIAAHHGRKEWDALFEPQTAEACALSALDFLDAKLRYYLDQRTTPPPNRGVPSTQTGSEPIPDVPTQDDPFADGADDPFDDEPAGPAQGRLF
ncbi:MAG: hypothetical protein HYU66_03825 [Armatimonadetes bacterium]|nr:hypothetical protein [Armatimonadota bacterium]